MIGVRLAFLKSGEDVDETICEGVSPQVAQRFAILSGGSVVAGESGRRSAKARFVSPLVTYPLFAHRVRGSLT